MNYWYNNNTQLFSLLLGILLNSSLYAITLYNEPLNDIIDPGYDLVCNQIKDCIVLLEMENDNLDINYISDFSKDKLSEDFKVTYACFFCVGPSDFKSIRACSLTREEFETPNVVSYKNAFINKPSINFESKILLSFRHCLLESRCISMTGNRMIFKNCYLMNTQNLYLSTNDPNSNYEFIEILFDNSSKIPSMISGDVDFLNNPNKKLLYITNVKQIRIKFKPQAWDNDSPANSQTNSENIVPENINLQSDSNFYQLTQQCFERVKQFFTK